MTCPYPAVAQISVVSADPTKSMSSNRKGRTRWIYRLLAVFIFLTALLVFVHTIRGETVLGLSLNRAFVIVLVLIFLSVAPYLLYTVIEIRSGRSAWREVAKQAGLTFQRKGGPGIPDIGCVTGVFRGRQLELFARNSYPVLDYEPDIQTVVRIRTSKPIGGQIDLWFKDTVGPDHDEDSGSGPLRGAVDVKANPPALERGLGLGPTLRKDWLRVRKDSAIRATARYVTLSQAPSTGLECDVRYLVFLFNLLSDLADGIEQAV